MRFVADECVDAAIVARLRADEHEVAYVAEFGPVSGDEGVLETANKTGALLLTADKDFSDLVFRLGRVVGGVPLCAWPAYLSAKRRMWSPLWWLTMGIS